MEEEDEKDSTILPPRWGEEMPSGYDRILEMVPPFDAEAESEIRRWSCDFTGTVPPPGR